MAVSTRGKSSPKTPSRTAPARGQAAKNGSSARAHKWVYRFDEGSASMRDLLGGKGAGVAEMTGPGCRCRPDSRSRPKPATPSTQRARSFPTASGGRSRNRCAVEKTTGKGFGDPRNPLLVSVRSGAKFSMPGMMDTVLNLGLNSATLEGLAALTKDRRFALDAHRRFIQLFSKIVLGIEGQLFEEALDAIKKRKKAKTDADLTAPALEELITEYRAIVKRHSRTGFPEDPMEQLRAAIGAVFESWNNKRATDYRNYNRIPHDLGTAVNVQSMVFGNMGDDRDRRCVHS